MRIAYVCADPGVPVYGSKGCSVHAQEVIGAFRELGHDVEVFAAAPGNGTRCHQLPVASNGAKKKREQHSFDLNEETAKIFESSEGFDLIYERYSLWSYAVMEHAHLKKIPAILEINAPLITEQQEYRELVHLTLAEEVARRAFRNASGLVVVSKKIQQYVEHYTEGKCRVVVVPNGVNQNRFPRGLPPSLPKERDTFVIGFLGSLKVWHGLPILAEAFSMLSTKNFRFRLLIVGDGPERDSFELMLGQMNLLPATVFTGAVPPSEVPGLLASMDVAVAPYPAAASHYFSPLKVYEYMAAGLPIVASRIGQITEVIEDEKNGLLVMPGSSLELARAIARLMLEPALAEKLGIAARLSALKKHTWKDRVTRILNLVKAEQSARV